MSFREDEYIYNGETYIKKEFRRPEFGEIWVRNYKSEVRIGEMKIKVWILEKLGVGKKGVRVDIIKRRRAEQKKQGFTQCFDVIHYNKNWCKTCSLTDCNNYRQD